jgi:protoheme IX farnesyltransferase
MKELSLPCSVVSPSIAAPEQQLKDVVVAYLNLTKPRIIVLLLITTLAGMFIAARSVPSFDLILWTMLGGAFAAGGANAINCYIDRDIDRLMHRTRHRSLPAGRVAPRNALIYGIALGVLSFVVFTAFVNLLAAVLAQVGLLFYVFIYTGYLKRSTPQNIVIGGAAGAMPPMVGYAAVSGQIDLLAISLFAIIFFWTPPHFWALSLLISQDYARANVPMLPLVAGEEETRRQVLLYSIRLVSLTAIIFAGGEVGWVYLPSAIVLGGGLVLYAARLFREGTARRARQMFIYSNIYLALLFVALAVDRIVAG